MSVSIFGLFSASHEAIFNSLYGASVGWLALIFFPTSAWSQDVALVVAIAYSVLYVIQLLPFLRQKGGLDFFTLKAVVRNFKAESVVLLGWTHYFPFDLMVARHVVTDAIESGVPHILVVPSLVLTCLLGPSGFVTYQITKYGYLLL